VSTSTQSEAGGRRAGGCVGDVAVHGEQSPLHRRVAAERGRAVAEALPKRGRDHKLQACVWLQRAVSRRSTASGSHTSQQAAWSALPRRRGKGSQQQRGSGTSVSTRAAATHLCAQDLLQPRRPTPDKRASAQRQDAATQVSCLNKKDFRGGENLVTTCRRQTYQVCPFQTA